MTILGRALNFHEDEWVISRAQTALGKFLLWCLTVPVLLQHSIGPIVLSILAAIFILPKQRRLILSIGTVVTIIKAYLFRYDQSLSMELFAAENNVVLIKIVTFVLIAIAGLYAAYRFAKIIPDLPQPIRKHPVLMLHSCVIMFFASMIGFPALNAFAEVIPLVIWRIGYLFQAGQRGKIKGTKFSDNLFHLWPSFHASRMPYGEGNEYLNKTEAIDEESDAKSRLAGLKLLWLGAIYSGILWAYEGLFFLKSADQALFGYNLGLPTIEEAIIAGDTSTTTAWLLIFLNFFRAVLYFAVIFHPIVGMIRLAGFNIFRCVYKPLLAETIIDFWGRFNYYFKKLMVEFFFYPTLLMLKNVGPRTRMFIAVFASACVGNMYLHLFYSYEDLSLGNLGRVWDFWSPRLVYCVLLATGIWVSMLRQQKSRQNRETKTPLGRVRAILGVWFFYAVIQVWNQGWNDYGYDLTWERRFVFSLRLIGIEI